MNIEPEFNLGFRVDRTQVLHCLVVYQYVVQYSTFFEYLLTIIFSIRLCDIRVKHHCLL